MSDKANTSSHYGNVVSRLELAASEREKETYLQALLTQPIAARVCVPIPLVKSEAITVYRLKSKEVGVLTSMVRSKYLRHHSFVNHENISLLYCPNVLKTHSGTYSVSIVNPDTMDVKVVIEDAPISMARLLVTNWPRSVPSDQNLFLHVECEGSEARLNTQLGLFKVLWEEKPSFRMIQVKDMPVLNHLVPETDPSVKMFTSLQLDMFLRRLMLPGTQLRRSMSLRVNEQLRLVDVNTEQPNRISSVSEMVSDKTSIRVGEDDAPTHPVVVVKEAEGNTSVEQG